jgi:hypothetical protein
MSSDQCALNPDGSFKDAKDIQWYNDPDDAQPLPPDPSGAASTEPLPLDPSAATSAQPLGRGRRNKVASRFMDALAREQLGSDDEDGATTKRRRRKLPARASNISGAALPSLASSGMLPDEVSSDGNKDDSFQSPSGSESGDKSGSESTDLDPISGNEV